jgi:hypothetical protein
VDLTQFDREAELARDVARKIGISGEEHTQSILTVGEHRLVVTPWCDFDRLWKVRVLKGWREKSKEEPRKVLTLAETYAIWVTQTLRSLSDAEHALFKLRMLVELGRVNPVAVQLAVLPAGAPPSAVALWSELASLLGIRWLTVSPDAPFPLSVPWFSKWSCLSEATVREGKRWLSSHGFLNLAGDARSRRGKPTQLWKTGWGDPS